MHPGFSNMASSGFKFIFFVLVSGVLFASASPAFSQLDAAGLETKFKQSIADTREIIKECREISVRFFHGGLDSSSEWQDKWNEASDRLAAQAPILKEVATDWFMVCKKPDQNLLMIAHQIAFDLKKDGKYESAKRLLLKVEKFMPEEPAIKLDLAIISLKLNEFERALELLTEGEGEIDLEGLNNIDKVLLMPTGELAKKWEREVKLREKDATADLPRVKLKLPGGDVIVELFEDEAPITVANFLYLIEIGYYDETYFHRVMKDLVAHGGAFNRRIDKVPVGHTIAGEMMLPEARHHFRGALSMFNNGNIDSADSEFSICLTPVAHLDWNGTEEDQSRYTVFGRVIEGMDAVDQLPATLELDEEGEKEVPIEGVIPGMIEKATIIRKRDHDYEFRKIPTGRKDNQSSPAKK